jgi:uncharacterized membrane protein
MLDFSCGVLAVVALILWVIADQPLYAVIFALMADALASFPTLLKAWKYPETETGLGYAMATLNACIGLIALSSITFINAAFLVYLILIGSVIVWGIYRRNPLQKLRSELAR